MPKPPQSNSKTEPTPDKSPDTLRPYKFHGLELQIDGSEAITDCPLCGREGKMSINVKTGLWQCFACEEQGNASSFLVKLWQDLDKTTTSYSQLATDRKLSPDTLMQWGAVYSPFVDEWLIPGYATDGKLQQLYRYTTLKGRRGLIPTPIVENGKKRGHRLHGVNLYDHSKSDVYLCEGYWDACALWECMARCKPTDSGFVSTANVGVSVLAYTNVLAVPGCKTFASQWCSLFAGKNLYLMYDNDHPRTHPKTNKPVAPAALTGLMRVVGIIATSPHKPASVQYLRWGEDAYQHNNTNLQGFNLQLPSGYDVRDSLNLGV